MEFDAFRRQLTTVLSRYREVYPCSQESENRFLMPPQPERLPELAGLLNVELPEDSFLFSSRSTGLLRLTDREP